MKTPPLSQGPRRAAAPPRPRIPADELGRLPTEGPLLLLAAVPAAHGAALAAALRRRRADLQAWDPAAPRAAVEALRRGAAVLAPLGRGLAGGRPRAAAARAEALRWARLARETRAPLQALDTVDGDDGRPVLRLGLPSAAAWLDGADDAEAVERLCLRLWLLRHRGRRAASASAWKARLKRQRARPLASRLPAALLRREIAALPAGALVAEGNGLQCWLAEAAQIPGLLREIGRAREEAFRAVGEGTSLPLDLDGFDPHYLHLFLWDPARAELAGGYRLGPTDRILAARGLAGLYTHSLLRFKPGLLRHLDPGLELGRSFVARRWQRGFAPLLLLWKGIGAYVAANPRYRRLFGVVSMSAEYQPLSRELIASYIKQHLYRGDLARLTRPRRPFGPAYRPGRHDRLTLGLREGLDGLDGLIRELEPDGKGLPVLFRQYGRLGGYFFGFNLDPAFGNALDGMVCVDLAKTDPRVLARYLGPVGATRVLAAAAARKL